MYQLTYPHHPPTTSTTQIAPPSPPPASSKPPSGGQIAPPLVVDNRSNAELRQLSADREAQQANSQDGDGSRTIQSDNFARAISAHEHAKSPNSTPDYTGNSPSPTTPPQILAQQAAAQAAHVGKLSPDESDYCLSCVFGKDKIDELNAELGASGSSGSNPIGASYADVARNSVEASPQQASRQGPQIAPVVAAVAFGGANLVGGPAQQRQQQQQQQLVPAAQARPKSQTPIPPPRPQPPPGILKSIPSVWDLIAPPVGWRQNAANPGPNWLTAYRTAMARGEIGPIRTATVNSCRLHAEFYVNGGLSTAQLLLNWRLNDHVCYCVPPGLSPDDEFHPHTIQLRREVQDCTVIIQNWPDQDLPWWQIAYELFCIPIGDASLGTLLPIGPHEILAVNPPNARNSSARRTMFIRWYDPAIAAIFLRCFRTLRIHYDDGSGHIIEVELKCKASNRSFDIKNPGNHWNRVPLHNGPRQFKWVWWGVGFDYHDNWFGGCTAPHAPGTITIASYAGISEDEANVLVPNWLIEGRG